MFTSVSFIHLLEEGMITHSHVKAIQCSQAYVAICRFLIQGNSLKESLERTRRLKCITEFDVCEGNDVDEDEIVFYF
jgi:hypothetical protein